MNQEPENSTEPTAGDAGGDLFRGLIEPSANITDRAERRKSRLLATALLAFTVIFLCVDVTVVATKPGHQPPFYGYALLASAFFLNRIGRYRAAATLVIAMFPIVVFAQVYFRTTTQPGLALGYLALAPMLGTILLPIDGVVFLSAVNILGLLLVPTFAPSAAATVGEIVGPISVNAIASAIAILCMDHNRRVEEDRRTEIADREARLRLALDGAEMGAWTWDIRTNEGDSSARVREIFGFDGSTTRGGLLEYRDRIHTDDLPYFDELIAAVRKGDRDDFSVEYRVVRPGAPIRWVEAHGSVTRDAKRRPLRMMGVLHDVTARRHTQEERESLEAQLRQAQKMEALGRFAGGVAHDFNNLLTVIVGNADLVRLRSPVPEVDEIKKAAESASSLTRRLLAFGRKAVLSPRIVRINDTLEHALSMLRRIIGEDIEIDWVGAEDLWTTEVDEAQLEQVILNLATNARDAMPNGGCLTLRTANVTLYGEDVAGQAGPQSGEFVRLTVSDNGVGMDDETKGRIFEPFFTTKTLGKGTGLGLAMVFGTVTQSGGFLRAESEPGMGSTFHLYFPRGREPASVPVPPADRSARGRETILVVEDEKAVRRLVSSLLGAAGYNVISSGAPDEALALWEHTAERVDLVLSDVVMPGMTGQRMVEQMRHRRPELLVLFMTGYAPDSEDGGPGLAGEQVLLKPFSQEALTARVRDALDGARALPNRPARTA